MKHGVAHEIFDGAMEQFTIARYPWFADQGKVDRAAPFVSLNARVFGNVGNDFTQIDAFRNGILDARIEPGQSQQFANQPIHSFGVAHDAFGKFRTAFRLLPDQLCCRLQSCHG
ncbi:MAG: hypothetical protein IPN78_01445 [Candidatus Accumulibacter sp.]|nr:hypothetical protein [Candidatus Accumulibacter propinquus]